jgi:hypothetical protein
MAVIGLVGPHAIGKTTACYRWLTRYRGKLVCAIADNQWEARSATDRTRVRNWKGTIQEKQQLVEQCQSRQEVIVIDSVRTTNLNYFQPTDPVIIVTCSWQVMNQVLRDRCKRNNKKFNEKYWDQWKLDYESHRRYLNYAAKRLSASQWKHFVIEDQARDWLAVDDYFGSLFRRLHNRIVRNRV